MTRVVIFLLNLFISSLAFGQAWDQIPESLLSEETQLNASFIKNNTIGYIKIIHQQKAPNKPIVHAGTEQEFYFNSRGHVIKEIESDQFGYVLKEIEYTYKNDRLTCSKTSTGSSVLQKSNTYTDGRMTGEIWTAWSTEQNSDTTLVKEVLIDHSTWNDSTEVYNYKHADGRPIYQLKFARNSLGYLLSADTYYQMGGRKKKVVFEYNEDGLLATSTSIDAGEVMRSRNYSYTNAGLLESIDSKKRNQEIAYDFVYSDTFLPKAILYKEGEMVYIRKYVVTRIKDMISSQTIATD